MKFIFDKDAMLKEIAIAQEIIATKNALSILSNVFLIAENDTLTIKATDIKVNFVTQIPIEVEEEGSTTVFCDKFISILNSLPSGEVEFNQSNTNIKIKPTTKKVQFTLKSMATDKFPEFASEENISYFDIPAKEFKDMVTQTIFAVSDDETRFFMNGVYFEKKDDNLILVATDGRRLAFISKPVFQGIDTFEPAIVPPKILSSILKHASSEGNISIAIIEKMIFFKFDSYSFSSVLIDGQFPNYSRVIPEAQDHHFMLNRQELLEALKRVGLLVEQKSRRIYFGLSDGMLTITSQESDIGTAKEEIPCEYSGDEITIAMNLLYLLEPLKVINSDQIKFEFTEAMKAVTLKPNPESDFLHIIMPMQME
ncbi:MAG: DNA polymerase III subunit beta [Treponema sp. CETP13]|nr:MAG: DNA polymerase III subunit beta [Treponema sp. CETP13]